MTVYILAKKPERDFFFLSSLFVRFNVGGLQFCRSKLAHTVHLCDCLFILLTAGVLCWYFDHRVRKASFSIGVRQVSHKALLYSATYKVLMVLNGGGGGEKSGGRAHVPYLGVEFLR